MKNDADNNQSMDLKERKFSLVLSDQKIRLNRKGARKVARLACEMAVLHSSPIESDKQYAWQPLSVEASPTNTTAASNKWTCSMTSWKKYMPGWTGAATDARERITGMSSMKAIIR